MKKNLWIIIVVIVLILIASFAFLSKGNKGSGLLTQGGSSTAQKNLFTSIKDAMTKSLSLKCEYQGEQGKTITYLKGSNVRVMYQAVDNKETSGDAILKDNKMWIWTQGEKEGLVIELNKEDGNNQQTDKEKMLEELERFKDKCSAAVVADSMFVPPSDVSFKDMTSFQQEMMQDLPEVPTE